MYFLLQRSMICELSFHKVISMGFQVELTINMTTDEKLQIQAQKVK